MCTWNPRCWTLPTTCWSTFALMSVLYLYMCDDVCGLTSVTEAACSRWARASCHCVLAMNRSACSKLDRHISASSAP